jgi:hypothetical protein
MGRNCIEGQGALQVENVWQNKKNGIVESFRRRRDSLLCLNYLTDIRYFAQTAAVVTRELTEVQFRQEDRGINA